MKKRTYGNGTVSQRGDGVFRLKYWVNGRQLSTTFRGSKTEANRELRKLVGAVDSGEHVEPSKITVGQWIDQWIAGGAPGRRKKRVGQKTLERYEELLNIHVKPALGDRPLQKLAATEIDRLYSDLDGKIAPMTRHHVHVVFSSCLSKAVNKGVLSATPMARTEEIPSKGEADHGVALSETELARLIAGFKTSPLMHPIVALAAASGCRRNELLALRWSDLDVEKRALRIERALDFTKKFGIGLKAPKTARGKRTLSLDPGTVALLLKVRETHLRIKAGVPDGVAVNLDLVKLPDDALMFPAVPEPGADFSFTKPRNPRNFSKEFARRVDLIGIDLRFHDLRGTHATQLLNRGVPVHVVAQRLGDDPAVVLRNYAKHIKDHSVDDVLGALASGFVSS